MMIGARASVLHDPSMDAIRILPPPRVQFSPQQFELSDHTTTTIAESSESGAAMQGESESSATSPEASVSLSPIRKPAAVARSKIAKDRSSKVPRPPNAFIIYRQHHHPIIKAQNPGVHNNQICEFFPRPTTVHLLICASCDHRQQMEERRRSCEGHLQSQSERGQAQSQRATS